ncbi:MAG: hypothetical protein ACK5IB_08865 [Qingshengfaniella sp.]
MNGLLSGAQIRLRRIARSAVLGAAGLTFALTGLCFMTAALWILIASHGGALVACTIIGLLYLMLGFCLLLVSARPDGPQRPQDLGDRPAQAPLSQIAEGFVMGIQAGRSARGKGK